MGFNHGLKIGQRVSTYHLQEIFKHNRYVGMRHSLSTNTLVLISNHYDSPYGDRWDNGILYYYGMGLKGNQKRDYRQNKTLDESKSNGVEVFLCEVFDDSKDKYVFMGRVELEGTPFTEKQFDEEGNYRDVWVFPLKLIDVDVQNIILPERLAENIIDSKAKGKKVKKFSLMELEKRATSFNGNIGTRQAATIIYERNSYVSEYTKIRANGKCQLCEELAPFHKRDGDPYLETHHIEWLSRGGKDTVDNTVALCPNCHRKMHCLDLEEDVEKLKGKIEKTLL